MTERYANCAVVQSSVPRSNRTWIPNSQIKALEAKLREHAGDACPVAVEYRKDGCRARLHCGEEWRVQVNDKLLDGLREYLGEQQVQVEY